MKLYVTRLSPHVNQSYIILTDDLIEQSVLPHVLALLAGDGAGRLDESVRCVAHSSHSHCLSSRT